jgi:hypothetical protein
MPRKRPSVPRTPVGRESEPDLVYDPTQSPEAILAETATGKPVARDPRHNPPTAHIAYTSRIEVIEAFQYDGNLRDAPDFIDRNWVGWDTTPILRVPRPSNPDGEPAVCRIGDYVVRQSVTLLAGVPAEERLEVWPKADFERLFIPKRNNNALNPPRIAAPSPDIQRPKPPVLPLIQSMPDVDLEELFHDTRAATRGGEGPAEDAGET